MIELKNVTKIYGKETVLDNLNLKFEQGKIIGLLGPNGSGKTTILKLINDFIYPNSGEVLINRLKPGKESKSIISYMPDKVSFLTNFKVNKIIYWYNEFFDDFDIDLAYKLLNEFEIDTNKRIYKLSKGQIEKVQLVITLSRKCQIYILDEPLGGIDPAARDKILDIILDYFNPDSMMIISTHLIYDIEKILDEIIFLKKGKVIMQDEADNIRNKYNKSIDEVFREIFK